MNRTDQVLNLLKDGNKWTRVQVCEKLGCTERQAHTAISILRNALAIQPGSRTNSYSTYTITSVGRERLAGKQRKTRTTPAQYVPPVTTPRFAIDNRPTLQTVWGGM
jgi:hypothetical protein